MNKQIFLLVSLILLLNSVFAVYPEDVFIQNESNFFGEAKELTIVVDNSSETEKDLTLSFYAPSVVEAYFLDTPSKINALERKIIKLKIIPSLQAPESTYVGTLVVGFDEEKISKKIKLNFYDNPYKEEVVEETSIEEQMNVFLVSLGLSPLEPIYYQIGLGVVVLVLFIIFIILLIKRNQSKIPEKWANETKKE